MARRATILCLSIGLLDNILSAQEVLRLDTFFRTGFINVQTNSLNYSYVNAALPLEDGRLIIMGRMNTHWPGWNGNGSYGLMCLNSDGTRDSTWVGNSGGTDLVRWGDKFYSGPHPRRFFMDGRRDTSFSLTRSFNEYSLMGISPHSFHVYPNGSVLACGSNFYHDPDGVMRLANVLRMDSTGTFDTTFTPRVTNYNGNYGSISLTKEVSEGRFILSGTIEAYEGVPTGSIIRIHANGDLDTSFHVATGSGYAWDCHEMPDGRLFTVGRFSINGLAGMVHAVMLMPDGSLDTSFNNQMLFTRASNAFQGPIVIGVDQLAEDRFLLSGAFTTVDGLFRGGLVTVDANGQVIEDGIADPGCTVFLANNAYIGSFVGVVPCIDGGYYAYGGFRGFEDDTGRDSTASAVIRLREVVPTVIEDAPTSEYVRVSVTWTTGAIRLDQLPPDANRLVLYDELGRMVQMVPVLGLTGEVHLDINTPGVYFVQVCSKTTCLATRRFVFM